MADPHFEIPRLVGIYDGLDADRSDLEVYKELVVGELGARSVIDIGCGTGTFACMLAREGLQVVGVDPAEASLDLARKKPDADRVMWIHGEVDCLPPLQADVATMTGNVAQVFVGDDAWEKTLICCRKALRPGGHLIFESRVPEDRAWERWTKERTYRRRTIPGAGAVEYWVEATELRPELVSFRSTYVFDSDAETYVSDSTLRFRTLVQLADSLDEAGFALGEVREAPDRPGCELVFIARRPV